MVNKHEVLSPPAAAYMEKVDLCANCEYKRTTPGTWNEWSGGTPPEAICPVGDDDPSDERCPNHSRMQEIEDALKEVDGLWR